MDSTPNTPEKTSESNDALLEAISNAEQVVDQYRRYLEEGQDDTELSEYPRPSDTKLINAFFDLQNEVVSNIHILNVKELHQILMIVQNFLELGVDAPKELLNCLATIVILLDARKEVGQLFEGKESTA